MNAVALHNNMVYADDKDKSGTINNDLELLHLTIGVILNQNMDVDVR